MATTKRTDASDADFCALVRLLDAELAERDGADHAFYAQLNQLGTIRHALLAYENGLPVGCGALRPFDNHSMEVKRMFVLPDQRGKGIAVQILAELERWATGEGFARCVLETGKRQPEAISLYLKSGYTVIPNYGQYAGVDNSICFEKWL